MKFEIGKAGSWSHITTVEINTLEELRKFSLEWGVFVIDFNEDGEELDGSISIHVSCVD